MKLKADINRVIDVISRRGADEVFVFPKIAMHLSDKDVCTESMGM